MAKKKVSNKKTAGRGHATRKATGGSTSKARGAPERKVREPAAGAPKAAGKKILAIAANNRKPPAAKSPEPKAARPKAAMDGEAAAPANRKAAGAKAPSPRKSRPAPAGPAAPDSDGYVLINGRRVRMMSPVEAASPARRSRLRAGGREPQENQAVDARTVKSKLTAKQLATFRELLLAKRAELAGDLSAMEKQALQSSSNFSHMPIHMADIGTDTYDQDFMLGLAETERRGLREIDEALQRINDGTYGICQLTGKPIPLARLNAKPWAKYTIEAARMIERGLGET